MVGQAFTWAWSQKHDLERPASVPIPKVKYGNIRPPLGDKTQFHVQSTEYVPSGEAEGPGVMVYNADHDVLISHIFGRPPTDDMLTGRTPRASSFRSVAAGLADAANKLFEQKIFTEERAGQLVEMGKNLLRVGMAQAPDSAALEEDLKAYSSSVVEKLKPFAAYVGPVVGLISSKGPIPGYLKAASKALKPYISSYGKIGSYISRMATAGNLTATSIGVLMLVQGSIQQGLARAQNDLKGGGVSLSESVVAPWDGYLAGDWVTVRFKYDQEVLDVGMVADKAGPLTVPVAILSSSKIVDVPLRDVAFVAQAQYNILVSRQQDLASWTQAMMAEQLVRNRTPPPNLPDPRPPPSTHTFHKESTCSARRRLAWGDDDSDDMSDGPNCYQREQTPYYGSYTMSEEGMHIAGHRPQTWEEELLGGSRAGTPYESEEEDRGMINLAEEPPTVVYVDGPMDRDVVFHALEPTEWAWLEDDRRPEEILKVGVKNGQDVYWELRNKHYVDLADSMDGAMRLYRYKSPEAARLYQNEMVPHEGEPRTFVVRSDPEDPTNPEPFTLVSKGTRFTKARRDMYSMIHEEDVYRVGDRLLTLAQMGEDAAAVDKMYWSRDYEVERSKAISEWREKQAAFLERYGEETAEDIRRETRQTKGQAPAPGGGGGGGMVVLLGALAAVLILGS